MNTLHNYIIEKLRINKNTNINTEKSKYSKIYNVDENDIVMIMQGFKYKNDIYIMVYPGRIEEINDNEIEVYNINLNEKVKDIFIFNDPQKSEPINNSFAFIHNKPNGYWKALIHRDKAIDMINDTLKRYKTGNIIWFGSFKLYGKNKRETLEKLLKDLNEEN